jgi:hypothetical protein
VIEIAMKAKRPERSTSSYRRLFADMISQVWLASQMRIMRGNRTNGPLPAGCEFAPRTDSSPLTRSCRYRLCGVPLRTTGLGKRSAILPYERSRVAPRPAILSSPLALSAMRGDPRILDQALDRHSYAGASTAQPFESPPPYRPRIMSNQPAGSSGDVSRCRHMPRKVLTLRLSAC